MVERISPKSVMSGDVIEFYGYMGQPSSEAARKRQGLVVDIKEKDGKVLGFDVFPLTPYKLDQFVKNDATNYMIGRRDLQDIAAMGLDTQLNYRLAYKGHVVLNAPVHLSNDGKGGVTRHGSIAGSNLLGEILMHAQKSKQNFGAFLGSSAQLAQLKGNVKESYLDKIHENRAVERGKNVHHERERQDRENGAIRVVRVTATASPQEKGIRKVRKNTPHSEGIVHDISLTEAAAKSFLSKAEVKQLSQIFDGRCKPLETLRDAFQLLEKNPRQFAKLSKGDAALEQRVKGAWVSFLEETLGR